MLFLSKNKFLLKLSFVIKNVKGMKKLLEIDFKFGHYLK